MALYDYPIATVLTSVRAARTQEFTDAQTAHICGCSLTWLMVGDVPDDYIENGLAKYAQAARHRLVRQRIQLQPLPSLSILEQRYQTEDQYKVLKEIKRRVESSAIPEQERVEAQQLYARLHNEWLHAYDSLY